MEREEESRAVSAGEHGPERAPAPYRTNSVESYLILFGGVLGPLMYGYKSPEQVGLNVILLVAAAVVALVRYRRWKASSNREPLGVGAGLEFVVNLVLLVINLALFLKALAAEGLI